MTFPKQLYWLFLLLHLNLTVGQIDSGTEPLQGFLSSCPKSCPWSSGQTSNKQDDGWCSDLDFQETQIQLNLPKFKNITLKDSDFYIDNNDILVLCKKDFQLRYHVYQLEEDESTANISYILSPQLQHCNLKKLDRRLYAYDESSLALENCKTKDRIALGDFYELPDSKEVVSCTESLPYVLGWRPRCAYVTLNFTEFEFLDNIFNMTIRLKWNKHIIKQVIYKSKDSSNITICFPLSVEMTKCTRAIIYPNEYRKIDTDHSIFVLRTGKHLNLGEYKIYTENRNALHYCQDKAQDTETDNVFHYCRIIQIISAALITLAVVSHLLFPTNNYHAKPLVCQMVSLAVWSVAGPYRYLWPPDTEAGCYALFAFLYFSALSSFLWLNVLAFDQYIIFAKLQTFPIRQCANMCDKKPKFLLYCVYAYCIPLVVTILSLVLEIQPSMQEALGLHPNIIVYCWFWESKSLYLFYSGPIVFQICVSMVLFGLTIGNLRQASEGVEMVNMKPIRHLFFVCITVFFIMGLCWIIEFITFLADLRRAAAYPAIIAKSIQGILLFVIYICKPSTIMIPRRKRTGAISSKSKTPTDSTSPKGAAHFNTSSTEISVESGISSENPIKEEITGNKTLEQDKNQTTVISQQALMLE